MLGRTLAWPLAAAMLAHLSPTLSHAQQAAEPAAQELPPVEVVTKKSTPKKKQAAKKQAPKQSAPAQISSPAPSPEPSASGSRGAETSTSPVENYVAGVSAAGTKTDTPLRETPQSISVVGKEQIRDQGVQNLNEALRYTPGVLADGFGFDNRGDYSIIRGVPADYYLDGLRRGFGTYYNSIPIEPYSIERVEVLRGPASMLYGQGSTGGIINAISKRPMDTPYGEITTEFGSFDFKQVKFDFTGPLTSDRRWLYRLTGLARDADTQVDFVENDRLMIQPSLTFRPQRDTSITVIGHFRKDQAGTVQQFAPATGTQFPNINGQRIDRSNFLGEPGDKYNTSSQSGTLIVDHKFSPNLKMHHASRYAVYDNDYDSHLPAILTPYRGSVLGYPDNGGYSNADQTEVIRLFTGIDQQTKVFNSDTNLTGTFSTGAVHHKVTGGYDHTTYRLETNRTPGLVTNLGYDNPTVNFLRGITRANYGPGFNIYSPNYGRNAYLDFGALDFDVLGFNAEAATLTDPVRYAEPDEAQIQNGIYIQDQIRFGPWIAVLGLRHDWLRIRYEGSPDAHETATTGRAGLMYEFDFGLTPYVSYTESFTPQPGRPVITQNDLDTYTAEDPPRRPATPVEGEQIEVGFKFQPNGAPWMINASVYKLEESNRVESPDTIATDLQGSAIEVKGFEIEAIGQVTSNIKAIASYAYTDAKYTEFPDPFSLKKGTAVGGIPKHTAALWGIYTVNEGFLRGLSFGAGVRYLGSYTDTSPDLLSVVEPSIPVSVQTIKNPSYTLFDAMVSYETEDWRWSLTAQNLEDEYYVQSCTVLRGDCAIGQARTIITGLTYKF